MKVLWNNKMSVIAKKNYSLNLSYKEQRIQQPYTSSCILHEFDKFKLFYPNTANV